MEFHSNGGLSKLRQRQARNIAGETRIFTLENYELNPESQPFPKDLLFLFAPLSVVYDKKQAEEEMFKILDRQNLPDPINTVMNFSQPFHDAYPSDATVLGVNEFITLFDDDITKPVDIWAWEEIRYNDFGAFGDEPPIGYGAAHYVYDPVASKWVLFERQCRGEGRREPYKQQGRWRTVLERIVKDERAFYKARKHNPSFPLVTKETDKFMVSSRKARSMLQT